MKRRQFIQLFAALPAVAMAQRAIPAVLGEPEYIAADDVGLVITLKDAAGRVVGVRRVRDFAGGPFSVTWPASELRGSVASIEGRCHGWPVRLDWPHSPVYLPGYMETLTVQGRIEIT